MTARQSPTRRAEEQAHPGTARRGRGVLRRCTRQSASSAKASSSPSHGTAPSARALQRTAPDLVLLDMMLPKISGLDVCRTIRTRSAVPIIMVTAKIDRDRHGRRPRGRRRRLRGQALPAARAVSRDARRASQGATGRNPATVAGRRPFGEADRRSAPTWMRRQRARGPATSTLDLDRHECTVRGSRGHLPLEGVRTPRTAAPERRPGPHPRHADRRGSGAHDYVGDTKTLDVHVKRLRSRIEVNPSQPTLITTIRGLGYRFETARRH